MFVHIYNMYNTCVVLDRSIEVSRVKTRCILHNRSKEVSPSVNKKARIELNTLYESHKATVITDHLNQPVTSAFDLLICNSGPFRITFYSYHQDKTINKYLLI